MRFILSELRRNNFLLFLKNHRLALVLAFAVGVLYIAPHIFFVLSLGDGYRGIPIMQTANEDEYLLRVQEIIDGNYNLGSPVFFEYKDQPPLSPPVGEFFYAIPATLFKTSPVNILIASRFYLPFILFLLVYFLIWRLTGEQQVSAGKINAAVGALFVTLGYDLIDFRSVLGFLSGRNVLGGDFLIWSRPVNPVLGAMFLFSFLLFIWAIINNTRFRKTSIIGAAFFLALMIGSYFFSWGIALSVAGVLILIYLFKKDYKIAGRLALVLLLGFLFALPYWIGAWQASASPWYQESILRSGLFLTHYPLFNKFLFAILGFYVILLFFKGLNGFNGLKGVSGGFAHWHWFSLALILGGLFVYNQQVITGKTVWPYHFVQYTIPVSIIVFMTLFYKIIREKNRYIWGALILIIAVSSLLFGVYTQASTYVQFGSRYAKLQNYASLFNWLNQQEKDCVVLDLVTKAELEHLDHLIPSFTRCNLYDSTWVFSLMPEERIYHNYFARLFLNGITAENIDKYLAENQQEARGRLFTNWKGLYSVKNFPDFNDDELENRIKNIPQDYRRFFKEDFISQLRKYRLDYIVVSGDISRQADKLVSNSEKVYDDGVFKIYEF